MAEWAPFLAGESESATVVPFVDKRRSFASPSCRPPSQTDAKGEHFIWLEPRVVNKLRSLRGPGKSYSDVILRLAAAKHE
jgi:hypothetical protein